MPNPIKDVLPGDVGSTVQSFITDDDVKSLAIKRQANGKFTITLKENCMPDPMKDVPLKNVGSTVQSFITDDDVKRLDIKQQPDGKFTITPLE